MPETEGRIEAADLQTCCSAECLLEMTEDARGQRRSVVDRARTVLLLRCLQLCLLCAPPNNGMKMGRKLGEILCANQREPPAMT